MLAGAVAMGVGAFLDPALVASPFYDKLMMGLALGGLSMEAGAIAGALAGNRGMNITTRQPASYRQVIYGQQRVGGVIVYQSTTGSHHNQYNFVIVIAGHSCHSIQNLYLDGRQVYWQGSGTGWTVNNEIGFGGNPDGNTHTGPNGVQYNFGGKVYCHAYYGNQTAATGYDGGLHANDPVWGPSADGTPYLGGCTYVYLKIEYDTTLFPSLPEIRFTVNGKDNIFDPRTNTTGFTTNWALIIADVLTNPQFGLGDASVNQTQLIAAANVCDEEVSFAGSGGGIESRYSCHYHYDTSVGAGDVLSQMMPAAAGRLSRVGGEWYIWPAYYQGPTASFGPDDLTAPIQWTPSKSFRELYNRVTGTYIAPNYPYNVAGNLYDRNGWYNGEIQNNFPYAFQSTNYPEYACDALHGYASDQYLNEDGGHPLAMEISQQCVLSVSQAQRLAKINLLRNRQQGSGTLQMSLKAFQLMPCDTFLLTCPQMGWTDKLLEVNAVHFEVHTGGDGTAPQIIVHVGVNETDASVYEWSSSEELSVYDVPLFTQTQATPYAPTNMVLTSDAATALLAKDGLVQPRIMVAWDTPEDGFVTQIQMQYQATGAAIWTDAGLVDVSLNAGYISSVIAGQSYSVRIRSLRANGAASAWVELDGFIAGIVLSVLTQDGVGIGSLVGEAFSDGTAAIVCDPFTALIGNYSVSVLPAGYTITGLNQSQLYYVYYNDPTTSGGAVTAVATQNKSDYLGKLGYYLIDSIITPYAASGSGSGGGTGTSGSRYSPSSYQDQGTRTTSLPSAAYDGDTTTPAVISASATSSGSTSGDCLYQGFTSTSSTATASLTVDAAVTILGDADVEITAIIGGVSTSLLSAGSSALRTTYTCPISPNTSLSQVMVEVSASAVYAGGGGTTNASRTIGATAPGGSSSSARVSVYEIFITT